MNTQDKINIMREFLRGEQIQVKFDKVWIDLRVCVEPDWDFKNNEYRVKPKRLSGWVVVKPSGETSPVFNTLHEARDFNVCGGRIVYVTERTSFFGEV